MDTRKRKEMNREEKLIGKSMLGDVIMEFQTILKMRKQDKYK